MTFLEALKIARLNPYIWFRPISWKGYRQALCVRPESKWDREEIQIVPTSRGGVHSRMLDPELMLGEWETVSPRKVNEE